MYPSSSAGTRIGSKNFVKGIQVSLMIENEQYRPQAMYWIYLMRSRNMQHSNITTGGMYEGRSTTLQTLVAIPSNPYC